MTDEAIAEHIIYLVKQHQESLNSHLTASMNRAKTMAMAIQLDMNTDDLVAPVNEYNTKQAAIDLVTRVQATLENRKLP